MITIEFTIEEINNILAFVDAGLRQNGLPSAGAAAYLQKKFADAANAPDEIQEEF
jgi:hypothetical protein